MEGGKEGKASVEHSTLWIKEHSISFQERDRKLSKGFTQRSRIPDGHGGTCLQFLYPEGSDRRII